MVEAEIHGDDIKAFVRKIPQAFRVSFAKFNVGMQRTGAHDHALREIDTDYFCPEPQRSSSQIAGPARCIEKSHAWPNVESFEDGWNRLLRQPAEGCIVLINHRLPRLVLKGLED
jgi:hypothetical protein